jgi:hypothetical protein
VVLPTLRHYSVTDTEMVKVMEYGVLEPPTPTVWTGSAQFTLQNFTDALQRRRNQFLRETGVVLTRAIATASPPSTGRFALQKNVLGLRRVAWTMNDADYTVIPLLRDDEWAFNHYRRTWPTSPEDPKNRWPTGYSTGVTPPLTLQVAPAPVTDGWFDLLEVTLGAPLNPATGVLLGVPDDWTWVVKWGALADLLSQEGITYDPLRAAYCESRWQQGIALAQTASVVLAARVNDTSVPVESVTDADQYRRSWQTGLDSPTRVLTMGHNIVGVAPAPDAQDGLGGYMVTLDVVANIPVPTNLNDCINDGVDLAMLDPLYDYVEHLALFKEGPGQLDASMALYTRFARACGITKALDQAAVKQRASILQQTIQNERTHPRLAPPEDTTL